MIDINKMICLILIFTTPVITLLKWENKKIRFLLPLPAAVDCSILIETIATNVFSSSVIFYLLILFLSYTLYL